MCVNYFASQKYIACNVALRMRSEVGDFASKKFRFHRKQNRLENLTSSDRAVFAPTVE